HRAAHAPGRRDPARRAHPGPRAEKGVRFAVGPAAARFAGLLFPLAALLGIFLSACVLGEGGGGGGGTETSTLAGRVVNEDGTPSAKALIRLRPADYLADIESDDHSKRVQWTETDMNGAFSLMDMPVGGYRLEIEGLESGGLIRDTGIAHDKQEVKLPEGMLRPHGSIAVFFAPDSEALLTRFVQVFGMERMVAKANSDGAYLVPYMPEGIYDLRFSSLEPFRRESIRRGVAVKAGMRTVIDSVTLEREAKLTFSVDGIGLRIDGLDSTNPVILDNELWDNGVESEYVWAKASLGALDLRGNIVTFDLANPQRPLSEQLRRGQAELRLARLAGLRGIPDPVTGAEARLQMPASGNLEDLRPTPTAGSDLIVAEARKATPEKPLLVVVGGPLTTVAQAYLTDPTIVSRMVVAGVFSYSLQTSDSVSNYLVAKKCRFVHWGRGYVWGGKPDSLGLARIPASRMGSKVRNRLAAVPHMLGLGDMAPVAYLFERGVWKNADKVKVSANLEVRPASDITFDFLDIPGSANVWADYATEFYATLANPEAYHPIVLPARFEAEAYLGNRGAAIASQDSTTGEEGIGFPAAGW